MRAVRIALAALFLSALPAAAEEPGEAVARLPPAAVDEAPGAVWLLGDADRLPRPMHAVVLSRFTFTAGDSPTRPLATNLGSPAAQLELGGELGLLPGLSAVLLGARGQEWTGRAGASGGLAGLRWAPLSAGTPVQLVVSGGWLRELGGSDGAWGRLSLGYRTGRVRTTFALHGEHVFGSGRDGVDLLLLAGASYAVTDWLRTGIEYAGQDLESSFEDDAEGGARHLLGPTAAVSLLHDRLTLTAGPALALGSGAAHLLGRISLAAGF